MELPARLVDQWRHDEAWLRALPLLVSECAEQWELTLEAPVDTPHSLVIPAGDDLHGAKCCAPSGCRGS